MRLQAHPWCRFAALLVVVAAVAPHDAAASQADCTNEDRFLVMDGGAFIPGDGAPEMEVVTLAPFASSSPSTMVSLASGCAPEAAKLRWRRTGVRIAVRWSECREAPWGAHMTAFLPPDCSTMTGTCAELALATGRPS